MELLRINDNKIKIMMNADDMLHYSLDCTTIEQSDSPSRQGFWQLLKEVRLRTGFDTEGDKIFVQVYPCKSGGCELFVTRLSGTSQTNEKNRRDSAETVCYRFPSLHSLMSACRGIRCFSHEIAQALTNENQNCFYLHTSRKYSILSEFDGIVCSEDEIAYIREHCHSFSDDAIRTFSELV